MAVVINGTAGITAPGTETFGDGTALGGATNPIVSMAKAANNYVQAYIVNNTDGANASADFVCYPSNGTDTSGWIDMGITGPTFSQAAYSVTGANEGYIFMSALSGASKTGNLVIATDSTGTANSIQFYTGGFNQAKSAARMVIDGSGNVSVGYRAVVGQIASGDSVFQVYSASYGGLRIGYNSTAVNYIDSGTLNFRNAAGSVTNAVIDSSGNLLVGTTNVNPVGNRVAGTNIRADGGFASRTITSNRDWAISVTSGSIVNFYSDNGSAAVYAGSISVNGIVTSYGSVSDYRLKENVQPMQSALQKVMALNPVTYTFKDSGQESQGFIAHELQAIVPDAVAGEKDAIKDDGSPDYQQIDTSFLVATLTAAIQEQQAIINAQQVALEQLRADVEALKAA